ncbi:MAG: VOC family protein [Gammaproteobacteria bacterium]|nr:VOC family protein [Gammaproteobacteria bacterium]MYF08243.1 VOC family protein [Rhodospirillaceae bacterium]MYJ74988.1 VOC family protein [Gammaproteobacteria bacterium]
MSDQADKGGRKALGRIRNAHHVAYRCRDAEQTRWFYEDVMGLPLAAALVLEEIPGLNEPTPYMHLFFEMGNGDMIAFFDEPQGATAEQFDRAHSFDRHIAFEVDGEDELLAWQERINGKGVSCLGPVDHGFVKSVYMYDPNGLQVEITTRTADYDEIMADELSNARDQIAAWSMRSRKVKVEKFGAEAVDVRSRQGLRRKK